jgi:hypothetical protein
VSFINMNSAAALHRWDVYTRDNLACCICAA